MRQRQPATGYDVAQVCPNGHVATPFFGSSPEFRKIHCEECGEETLTTCPSCQGQIRGGYLGAYVGYDLPAHCNRCGKPFPWTERKMQAAIELFADEVTEAEERKQFEESVRAVARDTPAAQVAANRITRLLKKVGVGTANAIREIVVDIASETVKRTFFQQPK